MEIISLPPFVLDLLTTMSMAFILVLLLDVVFFCCSVRHLVVAWAGIALSVVLLMFYKISDSYTGAGINEATWYHLKFGWRGLTWGQLMPIVQPLVLISIGLAVGIWWTARRAAHRRAHPAYDGRRRKMPLMICLFVMCLLLNPASAQIMTLGSLWWHHDAFRQQLLANTVVIDPASVSTPTHPKSVVYIYAESFEATFLDERLFPGLAPHLQALRRQAVHWDNMHQMPFTGWTIAGIIGSQCGFPALGENDRHVDHEPSADVTCLTDIAHAHHYATSYINGADLRFAGKDMFFQAHHVDTMWGKDELNAQMNGQAPMSDWGIYDNDMFALVDRHYQQRLAASTPFVLATLTVDTHPPKGHTSAFCQALPDRGLYRDGSDAMLNAVHCSDALIAHWVTIMQQQAKQAHRDDVIFVIAGDHQMAVRPGALQDPANQHLRHNMWMVLDPHQTPRAITEPTTTFDIAPTLLSMMGFDVPALALGRDVMRPGQRTLVSQYGPKHFQARINSAFVMDDGHWRQDVSNPSPTSATHLSHAGKSNKDQLE